MISETTTFFSKKDLRVQPIARSETIPSSWYTDARVYDIETDVIFGATWQFIGHASQLEKPGDYVLGSAGSEPIITIRGKDNTVRAFYNVCRHRGGPLAIEPLGNCSILQCKYHGWTYLHDGSLRGTPKFDRTELFNEKEFGLIPVRIMDWDGLYFVNPGQSSKKYVDVRAALHGISERIAPTTLSAKKFVKRMVYEINCNWKVFVDNYLEGYHLPFVHPELCNLLDYQKYVTETSDLYSLQYSPFSGKDNFYTGGNGEAFYYFVFPNFMMNILPGRLQTNLVLPVAHDKCRVIFEYYYDDISSPSAVSMIADDLEYSDRIQQEDIEICELVQRGLQSRSYDKGRFSVEMEEGVYHFQSLLKQSYAGYSQSTQSRKPSRTAKVTKKRRKK